MTDDTQRPYETVNEPTPSPEGLAADDAAVAADDIAEVEFGKFGSDAPGILLRNPDDPDSAPVLDFTDYAAAVAQAEAIGGKANVIAIGTAYHVNDTEKGE